ncbi:MAG: type II secretion system F family protein [Patescibacteria group bacterium]|nr:type II secretion system F family protein [Patescibacteria group bacterium]
MPIFNYKAKTKKGAEIHGKIEAININVASKILSERELTVVNLKRKRRIKFFDKYFSKLFNKIPVKDLLFFLRELSVLISANISLIQSLHIIEKQIENKVLRGVILEVADDVEGGSKLSESLSRFPDIFDGFYINIIKSGETSGKLDEVLNYLTEEEEKNYDMMKKLRGAMIYPAFIFTSLIAVGIVMMVFVVPKLAGVLEESGAELPITTRILMGASDFFTNFWWALLIGFLFIFFVFNVLVKTKKGKLYWDILKLNLPIAGSLLRKVYLVRFARSFITLMVGGVSVVKSLNIVLNVVDNAHYQNLIARTIKEVEDGRAIAGEFFNDKYIPPMFSQMMSIGEETGKIPFVLKKIADFYTLEIDNTMRNIMTIMEPFIMILMGLAVGVMVAAIILPMYNLSSSF